jgi:hypothetical protein
MMRTILQYAYLLVLSLLITVTLPTYAQVKDSTVKSTRWSAADRADKMSDKLTRRLSLTEKQSQDIYTINKDIIERMDATRHNNGLDNKARMRQIKSLNEERSQRFKTVLTAAQFKKWNDWEMKKKEHLEQKMDKKHERKESKKTAE